MEEILYEQVYNDMDRRALLWFYAQMGFEFETRHPGGSTQVTEFKVYLPVLAAS